MTMAAYLLPDTDESLIVLFDQTVSEAHEATAEVTEHPVETGSVISDHIKINPLVLNLEMFVTNTPIVDIGRGSNSLRNLQVPRYKAPLLPTPGSAFNAVATAIQNTNGPRSFRVSVLDFPEPFDRVKEIHEQLLELWAAGATMSAITSTRTYDDMVLVGVNLPRTEPGGASFNLNLKQIKTVTTSTVTAPQPLEKSGKPGQSKGSQSTKPVNGKDAVKSQSLAFKALEALGL
jgi:hypothetical protein